MGDGMTRRQFVLGAAAATGVLVLGGVGYVMTNWTPEDGPVGLLRERMGAGMSKVLVVYGTRTGCTADIAAWIGATLAEEGFSVDVRPAEDAPEASAYDAVVVGSGVRAGTWHGAVRKWVAAQGSALKARPTAFFTVGLTMASDPSKADEVRAYTDPLIAETGVQPVGIGLFAGMNEPKRFSLPERLILKAMKAPEGDFRDREAVASWARGLTRSVPLASDGRQDTGPAGSSH